MLASISLTLCFVIIGLLFYNLRTRRYELLSWRNLFLLGFFHFCCLGAYFTATADTMHSGRYTETEASHGILAALTLIFFVVFMIFSRVGYKMNWLQKYVPSVEIPVTMPAILISTGSLLAVGLFFAVVPPNSYLGLLGVQFRGGTAVAAVALATYLLLAQRFNPIVWGIFIATLGLAAIISTTGNSSRRAALAVLVAAPWVWYFVQLRYRPVKAVAIRMAAGAVVVILAITVYNNIRHVRKGGGVDAKSFQARASDIADLVKNPSIADHHVRSMLYTDTTLNTLFIIDSYPDTFGYQPGHGVLFVLSNPIPRFMWPSKPKALGVTLQEQMSVPANLGPGIIGHGWHEANLIGVLFYAAFFGLVVGFVDLTLLDRATNPYYLAVTVAGAGNVIAMARGDTPLFFLQVLASMISVGAILYGGRIALGSIMRAAPPLSVPLSRDAIVQQDYGDEWYDDGEYAETGYDYGVASGYAEADHDEHAAPTR